jgi:hypothetical protein
MWWKDIGYKYQENVWMNYGKGDHLSSFWKRRRR